MSKGKKFLVCLCLSLLFFALFWGICYWKFFDSLEEKYYLPVAAKLETKKIQQLSLSVSAYIDEQSGRFRLFAGNTNIRNSVSPDADSKALNTRAELAENLLETCPSLCGIRIMDKSGENLVFTTFPVDMENKSGKFVFKNKNNSFKSLAVDETEKSKLIFDEKQNQLIFAYPFFGEKAAYYGTIMFYLDASGILSHAVSAGLVSSNSVIYVIEKGKSACSGLVIAGEPLKQEQFEQILSEWNDDISEWRIINRDYIIFNKEFNDGNRLTMVRPYSISHVPQNILAVLIGVSFLIIFMIILLILTICCQKPKIKEKEIIVEDKAANEEKNEPAEQKQEDEDMFLRKKTSTEKVKDSLTKMVRHNSVSYFISPMNVFDDEEPEEKTAVLTAEKEPEPVNEEEKDDFDLVMNAQTQRAAEKLVEKNDEVKVTVELEEKKEKAFEPEKDLFVIDTVPVVEDLEPVTKDIAEKDSEPAPKEEKTDFVKPVVEYVPVVTEKSEPKLEVLEELSLAEEEIPAPIVNRVESGLFSDKDAYPSIFAKADGRKDFAGKKRSLLLAAEAKRKKEKPSFDEPIFEENGIFKIRRNTALLDSTQINYEFKHLVDSIIKN